MKSEKTPLFRLASAYWGAMLLVSIANGALRDFTYGPLMPEINAHQVSTLCSVLLLGTIIRHFCRRADLERGPRALTVGGGWVTLTVAFEFLFFHYVGGHAWSALLANYDLAAGRLWVLLLLWIGLAPSLFARPATPLEQP